MRQWYVSFNIESELESLVDIPALANSINHIINQIPGVTSTVDKAECPSGPMTYDVRLTFVGDKKIQVIKETRALIKGMGLKEAKDLVDTVTPGGKSQLILRGATEEEAKIAQRNYEMAGATVEVEASFVPQFMIDNASSGLQQIAQELESDGGQAA